MTQHTAFFTLDRETKGALRYQEIAPAGTPLTMSDPECLIGTLYLRKAALGGAKPVSFTVTLEDVEDGRSAKAA